MRRPRLYWIDWSIGAQDDVEATAAEHYDKIVFKGPKTHSTAWVDPGWHLYGGEDNILPTFVSCEKALPAATAAGWNGVLR